MIVYVCLLIMTLMGSVASLFLKRASSADGIKSILFDINLYFGGSLYFLSAIINIWVFTLLGLFNGSSTYIIDLYVDNVPFVFDS